MIAPWLRGKKVAGIRRGANGGYEGVVRVDGKVVQACGHRHRLRDQSHEVPGPRGGPVMVDKSAFDCARGLVN